MLGKLLSWRRRSRRLRCAIDQNDINGFIDFTLSDGSRFSILAPDDDYGSNIRSGSFFEGPVRLACELARPGQVGFDLGANIGAVALPLAARGCEVFAFEILTDNVDRLHRSSERMATRLMNVVPRAIWSSSTQLKIGGHSAWGYVSEQGSITVDAISLDDFVTQNAIGRIDLIKMDVEGSELQALHGMRQSLDRFSPDMIIEANILTAGSQNHSVYDLFANLRRHGYQLYQIHDGILIRFDEHAEQDFLVTDYLATKTPSSVFSRVSFEQSSLSNQHLRQLLLRDANASHYHRKYLAMQAERFRAMFSGDQELLSKLDAWRDEACDDYAVGLMTRGSQR